MQTLSIPVLECQYYDYSQAAAFFEESGFRSTPQLGLLTYYPDDETEVSTVGWYIEEDGMGYPLPVFKAFEEDYCEYISFTPMGEREIFFCDKCLYLVVSIGEELCIRRIDVLFDESIVGAFHILHGLSATSIELCKVYRHENFLGYYWIGKQDTTTVIGLPNLIVAPAFGSDEGLFNIYNLSEFKFIKVEVGEKIIYKATLWQILHDEQRGITIDRIMDFPDYSKEGKHMLN